MSRHFTVQAQLHTHTPASPHAVVQAAAGQPVACMVVLDAPHGLLVIRQCGHTLLPLKCPQLDSAVTWSAGAQGGVHSERRAAKVRGAQSNLAGLLRLPKRGSIISVSSHLSLMPGWCQRDGSQRQQPSPCIAQKPTHTTKLRVACAAGQQSADGSPHSTHAVAVV